MGALQLLHDMKVGDYLCASGPPHRGKRASWDNWDSWDSGMRSIPNKARASRTWCLTIEHNWLHEEFAQMLGDD